MFKLLASRFYRKILKDAFAVILFSLILLVSLAGCKNNKAANKNSKNEDNLLNFSEPITDYKTQMQKGKEYEQAEQFIYALGYYYDASENINASAAEKEAALSAFDLLAAKLENGEVGLKEENTFGIHDALIDLKYEMYQYFTEFCAYNFIFELVDKRINYDDRTVDYIITFNCKTSDKVKKIRGINYFKNLPYYNNGFFTLIYFDKDDFTAAGEVIINNGYITSMPFFDINNPNISDGLLVSSLVSFNGHSQLSYNNAYENSLYSFDFTILDSNGAEIQQFKNFPCYGLSELDFRYGEVNTVYTTEYGSLAYNASNKMLMKGIPAKYMQDFEDGTVSFRLDALYLPYGSFPYGEGIIENIQYAKKVKMPVRDNILKFNK